MLGTAITNPLAPSTKGTPGITQPWHGKGLCPIQSILRGVLELSQLILSASVGKTMTIPEAGLSLNRPRDATGGDGGV